MRGDPLFEIYSPELYSAQVEYLLAAGSASNATPGAEAIRASALTKLKFFDISGRSNRRAGTHPAAAEDPAHPGPAGRVRGRKRWWWKARWWTPG